MSGKRPGKKPGRTGKKTPAFDPDRPMPGVVHLPSGFQLLGKWGGGICLALALVFVWVSPGFALFWAVLSGCSGGLILAYRNWCVLYNHEGLETVSALGSSRKYGYDHISGAGGQYLYLQGEGKVRRLRIIKSAVGRMEFLNQANREYRKIHGNRPIPIARKEKKPGIFRGNVVKPGRYIGIYCIVLSLLGCMLLAAIAGTVPVSPENTDYFRLTFTNFRSQYRLASGLWFESPADSLPFFSQGLGRQHGCGRWAV